MVCISGYCLNVGFNTQLSFQHLQLLSAQEIRRNCDRDENMRVLQLKLPTCRPADQLLAGGVHVVRRWLRTTLRGGAAFHVDNVPSPSLYGANRQGSLVLADVGR